MTFWTLSHDSIGCLPQIPRMPLHLRECCHCVTNARWPLLDWLLEPAGSNRHLSSVLIGGWGDGQYLQAFPAVGIGALVDALDEVVVHHRLNVRARQRQDVAQALVPGMELPQAAGVLIQALRQREQQPASAVPVCTTRCLSATSCKAPGEVCLLPNLAPCTLLVQPSPSWQHHQDQWARDERGQSLT